MQRIQRSFVDNQRLIIAVDIDKKKTQQNQQITKIRIKYLIINYRINSIDKKIRTRLLKYNFLKYDRF